MGKSAVVCAVLAVTLAASAPVMGDTFKIWGSQSDMTITMTGRITGEDPNVAIVYDNQPLSGSDTQLSGATGAIGVDLNWTPGSAGTIAITDLDLSADPELNFNFVLGSVPMGVDTFGLNVSLYSVNPNSVPVDPGGDFGFDTDHNIWLGTGDVDYRIDVGLVIQGSVSLDLPFQEATGGTLAEQPDGVLGMTLPLEMEFAEIIDLDDWGLGDLGIGAEFAVVEATLTGTIYAVPEPGTSLLLVLGGLALLRRRRARS